MNKPVIGGDRVEAAFAGDSLALEFVGFGDIQAACHAAESRRRGLSAGKVWSDDDSQPGWWLRLDMPRGVVCCRAGRILIGPAGAAPAACRPLNTLSRGLLVDKPATKMVLEILGVPTPGGQVFDSEQMEAAQAYALSRRRPVCVKAARGSLGIRVFPNLTDPDDVRSALAAVGSRDRSVLVEDHVPGRSARFIFIKPGVVGARLDLPANVTGDGRSTVAELLAVKNAEKRRRTGQTPVMVGAGERRLLARQGLEEEDIPEIGRRVFLRAPSNLSQGGDCVTWNGPVRDAYAAEITRLCNAIPGLHLTAVDTVIADPTSPPVPGGWSVIELNAAPGVVGFHFPWEGEPQDMVGAVMDWLLIGEAWDDA